MDNESINWSDFDIFCRVIEHGGFAAAARVLDRPKSSLSAAVMRLESGLNARLLERTTRRIRLTEAGDTLYQEIAPLLEQLREAAVNAKSQGEAVAGTLRIAAPYEFGAHHLGAAACQMMQRHPRLKIHINVEYGPAGELFNKQYDIVFLMSDSDLPTSNIVARRVFTLERWLFAAPSLLARLSEPQSPEDLVGFPILVSPGDTEWAFTGQDGGATSLPVMAPAMSSSNAGVRMQAALAGLGVARITATYCQEQIRLQTLRRVLPAYRCAPLRIYALVTGRRLMPAKVRAFLDTLDAMLGRKAGLPQPGRQEA